MGLYVKWKKARQRIVEINEFSTTLVRLYGSDRYYSEWQKTLRKGFYKEHEKAMRLQRELDELGMTEK